jgi:hypothetical protein
LPRRFRHGLGSRAIAPMNGHGCTFAGKAQRNGLADARTAAGDQNAFAFEISGHAASTDG